MTMTPTSFLKETCLLKYNDRENFITDASVFRSRGVGGGVGGWGWGGGGWGWGGGVGGWGVGGVGWGGGGGHSFIEGGR